MVLSLIRKPMKKNNTITISVVLITLVVLFYILKVGASIIIPFVIALLLSFAIVSLSNFFVRKWIFQPIAFVFSLCIYGFVFWVITQIINENIQEIIKQAPVYQEKLTNITYQVADYFSIDQSLILEEITSKLNIPQLISSFASGATTIVRSTGTIFFFTIFILLEWRFLWKKIALMTDNNQVFNIIELIRKDMKTYFLIKTIMSFITGLLSYMVLLWFGVDFALFWAFLIFLLNYIPTVWSIVAVFFPVVFSLIQFESFSIFLFLLLSLASIQMLIWNITEPRLMGNKLNLSPLVILLSLLFWWQIWWVVGMLLCVPIMVIINIILAHIPATRSIAILLSEQGNIEFWIPEDTLTKSRFMFTKMMKKKDKKKKK